jgi:hypothetical protein
MVNALAWCFDPIQAGVGVTSSSISEPVRRDRRISRLNAPRTIKMPPAIMSQCPSSNVCSSLNQSAHFFAFSPISIDRRMASLRPILSRFPDNARPLK